MAKGSRSWAITGGYIPAKSTGEEPANTSRDELCLLNTGSGQATVDITIYYSDREPCGPYEITVDAKRMRNIRFNDLIDPEAIPLETEFACTIKSDVPVIAGFTKTDTCNGAAQKTNMMAFPIK